MPRTVFLLSIACLLMVRADAASVDVDASPATPHHRQIAIYKPQPPYPYEARARHITGAGVCIVYVRPDETVRRAEMRPSTGHAILDNAALGTFRRWRFAPGTVKRVKIPIRYFMTDQTPAPKT